MSQVTIAVIVTGDGTRYQMKAWRNGSRKRTAPKRPARLYVLTTERGWQKLEEWDGACEKSTGLYKPVPDDQLLDKATTILEETYGKTVQEIDRRPSNKTNHLGTPLGYGHNPA